MFEIGPSEREQKQKRQRVRFLAASFALHLMTALVILGGAIWRVPPLAEPVLNSEPLQILLPPPAQAPTAAASSSPPAAQPPHAARTATVVQPPPEIRDLPPADPTKIEPLSTEDHSTEGPSGPAGPPLEGGERSGPSSQGPPGGVDGGVDPKLTAQIHNPEIIPGTRVEPQYTEAARRAHLEGVVVLAAVVDERGGLVELHAVQALPLGLTEAAIDAVRQWRFRPATLLGRPVRAAFLLTVHFHCR